MPTADQAPMPYQAALLEHERLTSRANDWLHLADDLLDAAMGPNRADIDDESVRMTVAAGHAAAALALAYETRAGRVGAVITAGRGLL